MRKPKKLKERISKVQLLGTENKLLILKCVDLRCLGLEKFLSGITGKNEEISFPFSPH